MVETQPLLELDSFKSDMGITDDGQDAQILPVLEAANRRISLVLLPVLDIRKLESTDFWQDAKNVALLYGKALYHKHVNHVEEEYKSYKEEYDSSVIVLINAIKAQPVKDISKRSVLAVGGASIRHRLLDNNPGITDSLGNYFNDRYRR